MRRLVTFLSLLMLGATVAEAALDVEAFLDPERCRVGEQVMLTVTVSGGGRSVPEAQLPNLTDVFDIYDGGTSRNFSMTNGSVSSSVSKRYILVPKRAGSFVIDPITVQSKDETAQTESLKLEVLASNAPLPAPTGDASGSTTGTNDMFVRASVDVPSPYVSQQVTYRVRLYTALSLLESPGFTPPSTEGFWKESLPPQSPTIETVEGRRYQVLEVAIALFPTAPGELTLGESVLQCVVEKRDARRSNDPFRSVFGRVEGQRMTLRTKPITLKVKPLPPGAPEGFRGAVGEYRLGASLDKTESTQNESVTLTLTITGQGNLRTLGEITLPSMPEFRTFPSSAESEPQIDGLRVGGRLRQQFVLVPLTAGRRELPPIEIPVFSPAKGAYVTLTTDPMAILVAAGSGGEAVHGGSSRGGIELMGRDIRFIETGIPRFVSPSSGADRARVWLALIPIPAVCWLGVFGWERRRRRLNADHVGQRRRGAARRALKLLESSRAPSDQPAQAAEALRLYVADRWNQSAAGMTLDQLAAVLAQAGVDGADLVAFLDRCDAAQYAPSGASGGASNWNTEARTWIERLEAQP